MTDVLTTMALVVMCSLWALFFVPVLVFVCCKVGTYGYLIGRRRFYRDHSSKETDDGEGKAGA